MEIKETKIVEPQHLNQNTLLHYYTANGPRALFSNCDCPMIALKSRDTLLPLLFNSPGKDQAYLISTQQYLNYAKEELAHIKSSSLRFCYKQLIGVLSGILKLCHIDRTLQINNWLFPTSLYPELDGKQVGDITSYLMNKFPRKALWWRSVSPFIDPVLFKTLEDMGAKKLFARPAFYFDSQTPQVFQKRHLKQDLELLQKFEGRVLQNYDFLPKDYARIADLHNQLQCKKYSELNPILSPLFVQVAIESGFMQISALEIDGVIEAVYGSYTINNVMTAPLFGYNTDKPQELGLYRLLTALSIQESHLGQKIYHMSGGAGEFKQRRGAQSHDEYHFIFDDHLSKKQQVGWSLLTSIVNKFANQALDQMN
ncbi:MAG: hypothetical protein JHC93_06860 [Parachlamydiales bacterium]|nr:hypothetical protein [Parachlamydiales bacterium]